MARRKIGEEYLEPSQDLLQTRWRQWKNLRKRVASGVN